MTRIRSVGGHARLEVLAAGFLVGAWLGTAAPARAESESATADDEEASVNSEEGSEEEPVRRMVHWNEYEGRWFTARLGGGFLYDSANYSQDDDSASQFDFEPKTYIRDSRLLLKGRLLFSPRLRYTIGYMYDPAPEKKTWFWRQTGIYVDMPE